MHVTLTTPIAAPPAPAPQPANELAAAYRGASVLVAGGSAGIGQAILAQLLAGGARTACLDLRPPQDEGHRFLAADVNDPDALERSMAALVADRGGLEHLFVCYPLPELYPAEGIFHLIGATAPYLRDARGSVVFVASTSQAKPVPRGRSTEFTEVLAGELSYFGIRVNTVVHDHFEARGRGQRPASALDQPVVYDDVVQAALFLGSRLAAKVTGQVLRVGKSSSR